MTNKSGIWIVGAIAAIALVLSGLSFTHSAPSRLGGGDPVEPVSVAFINGLSVGAQNGSGSTIPQGWVPLSIGRGANQTSWLNNTGQTVYVDFVRLTTSGTASSSYTFIVGTSTTATVTDAKPSATAPFIGRLIDRWPIATSSAATTTSSIKNSGTNGAGIIPVAAGQYLLTVFEATDATAGACDDANCVNATSTNRGFNVSGSFHFTW